MSKLVPPPRDGMGDVICECGSHKANGESGDLRLRVSYSSMWSRSVSLLSANKAISGGRSWWWAGAQSTVGSTKLDPRNWATESAAADKIFALRPGGPRR